MGRRNALLAWHQKIADFVKERKNQQKMIAMLFGNIHTIMLRNAFSGWTQFMNEMILKWQHACKTVHVLIQGQDGLAMASFFSEWKQVCANQTRDKELLGLHSKQKEITRKAMAMMLGNAREGAM